MPEIIVYNQCEDLMLVKLRNKALIYPEAGFPKCAWCRKSELRRLCDVVEHGTLHDFVTAVCYCDNCHLATVVEYEVTQDNREEV